MLRRSEKLQFGFRLLVLITIFGLALMIFLPFTVPILMAAFVSLGAEAFFRKIKFKQRKRKYFFVGLLAVSLLGFLGPFTIITLKALNGLRSITSESIQSSQVFQSVFALWNKLHGLAAQIAARVGLEDNLIPQNDELFQRISPFIIDKTKLIFGALPDLGLSLFVFFCALFVFMMGSDNIKRSFAGTQFLPLSEIDEILQTFQSSCYMILVSTFLIGALQAAIVATGSSIFGFQEFFLVFVVTFFLSFIPVIGAAPVAVLLAIVSFMMGQNGNGIGLLVVAAIAGSIDNIIKPLVFSSDQKNLHPLVSLLGILGAISLMGLPGLLFGPLILQVSFALVPRMLGYLLNSTENAV